ncbi:hypothetical protein [Streptomyces pristinaespiralis]|uniref:hypothetical protein n=1 Tax=Streptomyces pristinaespiralis TaxID=38300 RepID=UPI00384A66F6
MTVQIGPQAAMLLLVGCVVGVCVFKYTTRTHADAPSRGDLVGAIGAAVGVTTVLALLIGVGSSSKESMPGPARQETGNTSTPPGP